MQDLGDRRDVERREPGIMSISDHEHAVQARSFGAAAHQYDEGRPSYPEVTYALDLGPM